MASVTDSKATFLIVDVLLIFAIAAYSIFSLFIIFIFIDTG